MKIYCAHQIGGLTYREVMDYYNPTESLLKSFGFKVLIPMLAKEELEKEGIIKAGGYTNPIATDRAILGRDHWMVLQSDVFYANLLGMKRVSIGCIMELAFAYTHHKHTVVVMEKDNPHRHAFVVEAADIIFETQDEAENYLEKLAGGEYCERYLSTKRQGGRIR